MWRTCVPSAVRWLTFGPCDEVKCVNTSGTMPLTFISCVLFLFVWGFFLKMDEVIDNIISMQSNYDDLQRYADPVQMPNTVSLCRVFDSSVSIFKVCIYNFTSQIFEKRKTSYE